MLDAGYLIHLDHVLSSHQTHFLPIYQIMSPLNKWTKTKWLDVVCWRQLGASGQRQTELHATITLFNFGNLFKYKYTQKYKYRSNCSFPILLLIKCNFLEIKKICFWLIWQILSKAIPNITVMLKIISNINNWKKLIPVESLSDDDQMWLINSWHNRRAHLTLMKELSILGIGSDLVHCDEISRSGVSRHQKTVLF